jgi:acyl-[acyl carrier protein]--UDP-N-acetylglucosamine O-acyltransferase
MFGRVWVQVQGEQEVVGDAAALAGTDGVAAFLRVRLCQGTMFNGMSPVWMKLFPFRGLAIGAHQGDREP